MDKCTRNIIKASIFLLAGFLIGLCFYGGGNNNCQDNLNYINYDLACEGKKVVSKSNYAAMKTDLLDFIERKKQEGVVTDISIYFRDLHNGPTLGINEHEVFSPASLLKLPLYITYENLKSSTEPDLFEREILVENVNPIQLNQSILPKEYVNSGESYSIKTMLDYMIKYSDNASYYVLLEYLRQIYPERDLLKDTFVDLGIIDPKDLLDNTISVKSYGSIFVQLYNSSYFSRQESSQEVLATLADIDWVYGLNAGLPEDIEVAHKFGERINPDKNLDQLHDCGIVYYPDNPYLLCVMTRGNDLNNLDEVIAEISKMVYEEFDSRKL